MENKIYTLTATGFKPVEEHPLEHGQIVWFNGYGHSRGEEIAIFDTINPGAFFGVNINRPDDVKRISNVRPESKKFGIGWYSYEPAKFATKKQIFAGLAMAEEWKQAEAQRIEAEAKEKEELITRLKKEYHYLICTSKDEYPDKTAIKNIRIELKRTFPGVKFSVTHPHHGNISVRLVDAKGQDEKAINEKASKICSRYQYGHFDGMTDSYKYSRNPFNELFGGETYVFYN